MSSLSHAERRCFPKGCRQRQIQESGNSRGDYVDARLVSDFLKELHTQGWCDRQIAAAAGCSTRTITDHRNQKYFTIEKRIAAGIFSVDLALETASGLTLVDSLGVLRRLQALMALGHALVDIAGETGMHLSILSRIAHGACRKVTTLTSRRICDVYERWSGRPGGSIRTRRYAERRKWAPPLAWDDIDNPDETPNFGEQVGRYQALAEDGLELIHDQNYTRAHAAERLGVERDTLDAAIAYCRRKIAAA